MTGYASATQRAQSGTPSASADAASQGAVTVELRSVNSRFLDLALRLPDEYRALEPALRDGLTGAFKRGKIELRLNTELPASGSFPQPSAEQMLDLARLETTVQSWLPKARPMSVGEVLSWCRSGSGRTLDDALVLAAAQAAIRELVDARAREGDRLVMILMERVGKLREFVAQAQPLVPQVVARQQRRFIERWNAAIDAAGNSSVSAEQVAERALNEAAAFAIRIDVAEEIGRLGAHLDEISRLLKSGGELGKRLDFLIQELHREANTLGSKSAALELTQISVEMKVLIEQMREQVQNIE
ncbi:MAG: hypothetical protein RIQ60_3210 [Pseudomonadota bacterium]